MSKASKLSMEVHLGSETQPAPTRCAKAPVLYKEATQQSQYLYFCTSKASKLSTCAKAPGFTMKQHSSVSIYNYVLVKQVN